MLGCELSAWCEMHYLWILGRNAEFASCSIGKGVVGDEVVCDLINGDADGFFDKTIVEEIIRIDERSDERSFHIGIHFACLTIGTVRCSRIVVNLENVRFWAAILAVGLGDAGRILRLLQRLLLLAWSERLLELTVDEEVSQNSTWAP